VKRLLSALADGRAFFNKIALIVRRQIFYRSSRYNRPPATVPFVTVLKPNPRSIYGFEISMNSVPSARAVCVLFEICLLTRLGDKT
jgi:hypothetical protein